MNKKSTRLRVSDFGDLKKYNILKNRNLLKIITEKTDDIIFIPIHIRVAEIIDKYGGTFPNAYSDQKMNDYIKEVCRIAGIDDETVYKRTRGGRVERFTQPKYERITNHTARRSFATNLYLAGFDTISIMKITGHKKEENFMKYICVTQRQMAERMLEHPYFKK